jgi:hypothetical protein
MERIFAMAVLYKYTHDTANIVFTPDI